MIACPDSAKRLPCGPLQRPVEKSRLATQRRLPKYPLEIMAQSEEEDDYMNMVFEDAPKGPKYETSLQRAARKRKEVRSLMSLRCAELTGSRRAKPKRDRRPRPSAKQKQNSPEKHHLLLRCPRPTKGSR